MSSQLSNSDNQGEISPEAKELAALKEELLLFASLINHDFKEPVRTISAFSSLLGRRLEEEDNKSQELLGFIQGGAVRMGNMIEALVEYIRIERYMESLREVDCTELLLETQADISMRYSDKNVKIDTGAIGNILTAPNSVRKLFKHIINNAVLFQNQNNEPHISISSIEDSKGITIFFDDNGIGVPDTMMEQIFEPFRRLNAIGTYKGCGLGLAACKKIMDLHGGKIWAEKSSMGGLRIGLYFPENKAKSN